MELMNADRALWESFLQENEWKPFLQSFSMGEVYGSVGEEPIRIAAGEHGKISGICQAIIVPAKRGKHLAVMYGPLLREAPSNKQVLSLIVEKMKKIARDKNC